MADQIHDVIVVGGGIIGATIAWRLAQRRFHVALFDAGVFGGEASSAAAGMLAPGGEIFDKSPFHSLLLKSHAMYPAFTAELTEDSGHWVHFRRCGAFELADNEREWELLRQRAAVQAGLGIRSEVGRADSMFYPDDAVVCPLSILQALHLACERRRVRLMENQPVHKILVHASHVEVDSHRAAFAVLAAGAGSSAIECPGVPLRRSYPVKGHLIGYDGQPRKQREILRHGSYYVLQRPSGYTVAGSTTEPGTSDKTVDPLRVEELKSAAGRLAPELNGLEPSRAWTGLRPAIEGPGPEIRRVPGSPLWLAYGHFRNGILGAPATAEIVANGISGIATPEKDPSSPLSTPVTGQELACGGS